MQRVVADVSYSSWQPHFALMPVKSITGKLLWLKTVYRREVKYYTPATITPVPLPVWPAGADKVQYASQIEIAERTLLGLK